MDHLLFYTETKPWIDNIQLSLIECPECRKRGQFRRGHEFEGEVICMKCRKVWEPGKIEIDRELQAKHLENQFGDGI